MTPKSNKKIRGALANYSLSWKPGRGAARCLKILFFPTRNSVPFCITCLLLGKTAQILWAILTVNLAEDLARAGP